MHRKFILWFKDVEKEDVRLVGNKGAQLGEMTKAGFPTPSGFIITTNAYNEFWKENDIAKKINTLLKNISFQDNKSREKEAKHIQQLILQGRLSEKLTYEIFTANKILSGMFHNAPITVSASSLTHSGKPIPFGKTFPYVKGEANLLLSLKEAWASLFEPEALAYYHQHTIDLLTLTTAVLVQKVIHPEQSGVLFTINPETNDKTKISIKAVHGTGDLKKHHPVTDRYEVSKNTLLLLHKTMATQQKKYIKKEHEYKEVTLSSEKARLQKISNKEIIHLATIGKNIEKHYYFPQEISWAIEKGNIYITGIKPITHINNEQITATHSSPLLTGHVLHAGITSGMVRVIREKRDLANISYGDIIVLSEIELDYIPILKRTSAVIIDNDMRDPSLTITLRDIGIPTITGTHNAAQVLQNDMIITVNGTKGEVYKGTRIKDL